jgi:hypothetical protein
VADEQRRGPAVMLRSCRQLGCQFAGVKFCRCLGRGVARPPGYVVWATPTHPTRSWAVGHEIRPGCLKVVAYVDSKLLADALAKRSACKRTPGELTLPGRWTSTFYQTPGINRYRTLCVYSM